MYWRVCVENALRMIICRRRWRDMATGAQLTLSPYFYLDHSPRPEDEFVHGLVNLFEVSWDGDTDVAIVRPWAEDIDALAERYGIRGDVFTESWETDAEAYSHRLLDSRRIPDTPFPGFGLRFSPDCFMQQVAAAQSYFNDQRSVPSNGGPETSHTSPTS